MPWFDSKCDCRAIIHASSIPNILNKLNLIYYAFPRLVTSVFCTLPIISLLCELKGIPSYIRTVYLNANLWAHISSSVRATFFLLITSLITVHPIIILLPWKPFNVNIDLPITENTNTSITYSKLRSNLLDYNIFFTDAWK